MIGIAEVAGKAAALRPLMLGNPDLEVRRLIGTLDNEVEPKIQGAKARAIGLTEGGFAIVVRVPKSFLGPHRCGASSAHRFVVRNNTMTNDMSYDQVRSAFQASSTLADKATSFIESRLTALEGMRGHRRLNGQPLLVVHLVPFQGLARRLGISVSDARNDPNVMRIGDAMNWYRRPNLHGIALYEYEAETGVDEYVQIYRDGCVEYVKGIEGHNGRGIRTIFADWIAAGLRDCIHAYHRTAQIWDLGGPVFLSASLLHCAGVRLDGRRAQPFDHLNEFARMDLGDTLIDDIAGTLNLDALSQPSMDVLFHAFEQPKCTFYDAEGNWIAIR